MYLSTVAFLGFLFRKRLGTLSIHQYPLRRLYEQNTVALLTSQRYSYSKLLDKLNLSMATDVAHNQEFGDFSDLLLEPDEAGVHQASELLSSGGIVAFPTETVYGLGMFFNINNVDISYAST
jgi:hypothetical protein